MRRTKKMRDRGVHVCPYWGTNQVTSAAPELKPFMREWETYPRSTIGQRGQIKPSIFACLDSESSADYMVWALAKVFDDIGYTGVYIDASSHLCSNHYHGCGWRDEERGEWRPTHNMFAWRETYKRMYKVCQERGTVMIDHGTPAICVGGFLDLNCQGESWHHEKGRQYDRLTPEIFRVSEMHHQYGVPYTWYVFHHRWRGRRHGGQVPLKDILTYTLPHYTLPFAGKDGMWPVWDVTDQFWTDSEFLPYWSPECPVSTNRENVLATVYRQQDNGRAWLVVANWNTEPRDVTVAFDLDKLGLGDSVQLTRALDHPIRHPYEPEDVDPMKNAPLKYAERRLSLSLSARNLEIIRINAH